MPPYVENGVESGHQEVAVATESSTLLSLALRNHPLHVVREMQSPEDSL